MDIREVQSSQILPISGYEIPVKLEDIKKIIENYFFSLGPIPYKIYKNSFTTSLGSSPTSREFINNFFIVLENAFKIQIKENESDFSTKTAIVSELFGIIHNVLNILEKNKVELEAKIFYSALIGFILAKIRK